MKLVLALLSTAFASASAVSQISEVSAESNFGQSILSKSRRVEQDGEADQTWIANMSLKFMGCHHISQWNSDADGADDVRIETKRLAKFRLCPSNSCNGNNASGCSKGYGDYIVDMDNFLASYLENKAEVVEETCNNYLQYSCNCQNNGDDAFDEEYCQKTCLKKAGLTECLEQYNDDDGVQFELNNYLECNKYEGNGRRLEYYNNNEYYIGSYCSSQGGAVHLGMFTDDACTNFADNNGGRTTYYQLEGQSLPYSESSIVENSCWSCADQGENQYYNEPKQMCTDVYDIAGKCESNLSNNYNKNENACGYLSGIKTASGSSGIINSGNGRGNKVASAFITIFGISFVALGSYVYYLKTKLDRGRINLSD